MLGIRVAPRASQGLTAIARSTAMEAKRPLAIRARGRSETKARKTGKEFTLLMGLRGGSVGR
jgi:hypothetical protein